MRSFAMKNVSFWKYILWVIYLLLLLLLVDAGSEALWS